MISMQNRTDFLRISGEQKKKRKKRGEQEARVACGSSPRTQLALRARLAFAIRKKITPVLQAKDD